LESTFLDAKTVVTSGQVVGRERYIQSSWSAPYSGWGDERDRWSSGGPAEGTVLSNAHPLVCRKRMFSARYGRSAIAAPTTEISPLIAGFPPLVLRYLPLVDLPFPSKSMSAALRGTDVPKPNDFGTAGRPAHSARFRCLSSAGPPLLQRSLSTASKSRRKAAQLHPDGTGRKANVSA
jgi:hypothetical protein